MKKKPKKLSARARKKELTGINLAAIHKKLAVIDQHLLAITMDITDLFNRVDRLEGKKE